MTSFTENEHEPFAPIPTWPCEWPEVVVRDSIVAPKLGTQANPIVIDDPAPLGSPSNPIVIHVDEDWCRDEPDQLGSDTDTEIMDTPEIWGTLTGGSLAIPVNEGAAIDSSSVPTRSPVCEDPKGLQPFEQSTPNCLPSDHESLKIAENSFDASREYSCFGAARRESIASDHRGSEQSPAQLASKIEEPKEARSVPDTSSMIRNAVPKEISIQTDTSFGKGLPCDSYDMAATKCGISHETAVNMNRVKCLSKTASTWGSSVSTAIGDELAAIYDHLEHCRNVDCLQAKAFYDVVQSPQNTLPNNLNSSKQLQGRSEEGRVTMRFHVPEFQKGATWPIEYLVDRVIIRTDYFSPDIPCNLEICKHDNILFGRGAVVVPLKGEDPKFFLTFSPKVPQDDHGTNVSTSGKRSDGTVIIESVVPEWKKGAMWRHGFICRISIELYKRWPPLASDYEEREDFVGSTVLSIHSDGVDPKCFLAFPSGMSLADHKPHPPAPYNGVREFSMTGDPVAHETTGQADTSVGNHAGSVKRKLSRDGIRSELRRSERLTKRGRT